MSAIRILGIDPGLGITGYGVIEKEGPALRYVASGRVRSDAALPLAERLSTILDGLAQVIASYHPLECAVEKVFVNVNPQSTLLLGQARGAAICAAVLARLPVAEYTALQVKQAVVGQGHARKEQVQEMVKRLLGLAGRAGHRRGRRARLRHLPRPRRHGPGRHRHARPARARGQARMIGRIHGILTEKNPPQVLVVAHGVGYEIDVPMSTFYHLPRTGENVELLTHLVVREDAHLLFGFLTAAERAAFRQLLKVSGVGPKVALAVLSGLSVEDLGARHRRAGRRAPHQGPGRGQEDGRAARAGAAGQAPGAPAERRARRPLPPVATW